MPRKNDEPAASAPAGAELPTPTAEPAASAPPAPPAESRPPQGEAAAPASPPFADPHSVMTISLSAERGGPAVHLLRSHKFHQMQVRFDGGQPDEHHLAELQRLGWRDRTQEEGVWTKQIDRNARWQSVDQMEREFKMIANEIRREKGLEPAMQGITAA